MPDDSYCACGDAAEFTVTEADWTRTLCPRCTVITVRDQLPEHLTVVEIPDEFDDDEPTPAVNEPRHCRENCQETQAAA